MTQLSPLSQKALARIKNALEVIEKIIELLKAFIHKKIPYYAQNIVTALIALKDIASFVPTAIYKTLFYIAVFSILYRKIKKWRMRRLQKEQTLRSKQMNLQNLGASYLVNKQGTKSVVGNARTQIDSFDFEFEDFHETKGRDFRDIVFFDLMKSYKESSQRQNDN